MKIAGHYSINDLEKLSGIKAHTIRIWEKRYKIVCPKRTDTNIRYYSNEDLKHLLNISILNKHGYKISVLSGLKQPEINKCLADINFIKAKEDDYQEDLLLSMLELNESQFNKVFLTLMVKLGFENTIIKIIFPFFERIGVMWQTGAINPAQEHFISNMLRQKIIAATDALTIQPGPDVEAVLLFLPENELHEIGLLFYNYLFKARGYKTIYLGSAVPLDSLNRVTSICHPDMIVTGMTNAINPIGFESFCKQLIKVFRSKKIFFTGPIPLSFTGRLPKNAFQVNDLLKLLKIK